MASSRQMRRSRRESPMNLPAPDVTPIQNIDQNESNYDDLSGEWVEPPLRTPVPSFEDYKGLERQGVLEHMAPLGSLPNSKVKARLKQYEPPRRATHLKNGEMRAAKEEVRTVELGPQAVERRSESRKVEDKPGKISSSRERDEDQDYTPITKSSTRAGAAKPVPTNTAHHGTPSSRTAQGRQKLKEIVDSAVKRSNELGDPVLGDAVNDLYEESLRNPAVAELLDAVLTQKPSPQQTAEFQSRIRAARKKHRDNQNGHHSASKAISTSPAAKSSRSSATRHSDSTKPLVNTPVLNSHPPTPGHCLPKLSSDIMEANGTSHEQRPAKRIKRSLSASSGSSLSSLDSAIDEEPPPTMENNHISSHNLHQTKAHHPNGPRLGTFPVRPSDSASRKPILLHTHAKPPADDATAKKREELKRKFNQYVGVRESAIRSSPSPIFSSHSTPPVGLSAERNQQSGPQNESDPKRRKIESEPLDSPASSSFGELLVPPPPGASRGITPNSLGRPPKALKKAARIKMS